MRFSTSHASGSDARQTSERSALASSSAADRVLSVVRQMPVMLVDHLHARRPSAARAERSGAPSASASVANVCLRSLWAALRRSPAASSAGYQTRGSAKLFRFDVAAMFRRGTRSACRSAASSCSSASSAPGWSTGTRRRSVFGYGVSSPSAHSALDDDGTPRCGRRRGVPARPTRWCAARFRRRRSTSGAVRGPELGGERVDLVAR